MFHSKNLISGVFLSFFLMLSFTGFSTVMAENSAMEEKPILVDIQIIPSEDQVIATSGKDKATRVVLMGSKEFDVMNVDHHSLNLQGVRSDGNSVIMDKNNDGFNDFIVEFSNKQLNLKEGDNQLTFKGFTKDGKSFEGSGSLTVPKEKK